jgi:transaldolase
LSTEVLVASIRHPGQVVEAARLGADVATMPPKILNQLVQHPLTDKGLAAFLKDWEASGQRILDWAAPATGSRAQAGNVAPAAG